ncbi:hypothetical protein L1049_017457 [Liquidambar formosana]|uniref:RNase H type-1 domain-containing protein n=1 Tax=Liquidambar formosana TaxID=63359 RepID=A0AAP0X3Q8_LIQFO
MGFVAAIIICTHRRGSLLKINTDGAWMTKGDIGGVGMVIRDERGLFIVGIAKRFQHMSSAQMVEATALREGIRFVLDNNFKRLVVETDAKSIRAGLKTRGNIPAEVEILCDYIKQLAREAQVADFIYLPRNCNQAA